MAPEWSFSLAGPIVRIHLPPGKSLRTFGPGRREIAVAFSSSTSVSKVVHLRQTSATPQLRALESSGNLGFTLRYEISFRRAKPQLEGLDTRRFRRGR